MKLLNIVKNGSQNVNGSMQRIKRAIKGSAFFIHSFPVLRNSMFPIFELISERK